MNIILCISKAFKNSFCKYFLRTYHCRQLLYKLKLIRIIFRNDLRDNPISMPGELQRQWFLREEPRHIVPRPNLTDAELVKVCRLRCTTFCSNYLTMMNVTNYRLHTTASYSYD